MLKAEEKEYRGVVNRLALTMLLFFALYFAVSFFIGLAAMLAAPLDGVWGNVVYQLFYAACYGFMFLFPVFFYRLISKKEQRREAFLAPRLPRETPLYILAGIAVVTAAAYVNSYLLEPIFHYGSFSDELLESTVSAAQNYELILSVLTVAVLPAFVEELLFRGLILTNLLPYGRTSAVLASALLFGVMHQNAGQLLYATAAGLVLGYVYVQTRSIWPSVLIHFCNNFLSVLHTALMERLPYDTAVAWLYTIEAVIVLLGLASGALLILRADRRKKTLLRCGCFERELQPDPEVAATAIPLGRRIRLFFSWPMLIYLVAAGTQIVLLLLLSLAR